MPCLGALELAVWAWAWAHFIYQGFRGEPRRISAFWVHGRVRELWFANCVGV